MHIKISNAISNLILIIMVVVNSLMLFNINLYNLYTEYSIYILLYFIGILFVLNIKNIKLKELSFVFFLIMYLILDANFYTNTYGSSITLLLIILLVNVISKIPISKKFFITLYIMMIMLNLFLFYKSFTYNKTFTMEFNSNQMAMNMYVSLLHILILSRHFKVNKIINSAFIIINIWGINKFDSRTTYIALFLFFILVYLIPIKLLFHKIVFRLVYYTLVILSLIVPYIYTYMWKNNFQLGIELMGKRFFTGREEMWNELFSSMNTVIKTLFGLGHDMVFSNGLVNAHNITLHIIMCCGLIACAFYYIFIFNKFEYILKNFSKIDKFGTDSLCAFLSTIAYGYFENPIQANRMIFIYIFIIICINECLIKENERSESKDVKII